MHYTPRCVLFDLDGTLIDTAPDLGGAANDLRSELGMPPLSPDVYRPEASHGAGGMLRLSLGLTPQDADFDLRRQRYLEIYRARLSRCTRPFAGVAELLDRLDACGLRWGVVTNKSSWLAQPLMDDLDLSRRITCLVCGDTAARPKPAADPLLYACEQIGVTPADCIYVGDDLRDIQAGHAAGMPSLVALWGYLGADARPQDWGADAMLDRPAALLDRLELRRDA